MFSFEQIKELVELVADHGLQGLEVERAGFRVQVTGKQPLIAAPVLAVAPPPSAVALPQPLTVENASPLKVQAPETGEQEVEGQLLESPIVGTYYSAPGPDAEPFVSVGDRVRKGQVLCIVEAMKLMNEIEADIAGEVTRIYPENAQPVEYGEPLFSIKP